MISNIFIHIDVHSSNDVNPGSTMTTSGQACFARMATNTSETGYNKSETTYCSYVYILNSYRTK